MLDVDGAGWLLRTHEALFFSLYLDPKLKQQHSS
jgi:hypothetical protein